MCGYNFEIVESKKKKLWLLLFNIHSKPLWSCRMVSWPDHTFPGQLRPTKQLTSRCKSTFFCKKLTTSLLESAGGREWLQRRSHDNLNKRMVLDRRLEPATPWSPVGHSSDWATKPDFKRKNLNWYLTQNINQGGWKLEYLEKTNLTVCKQNLAYLTCVPSWPFAGRTLLISLVSQVGLDLSSVKPND